MAASIILVEATPLGAGDGAAQTVRLAGGGYQQPYYRGGEHWRAGVVQLPTITTSINFDGGDFPAGGVPQAAEVQWAPSTKADLAAVANLYWIDAPVTVRIGAETPDGALPAVALAGKALSGLVDGGVLKIQMSDPAADLIKPLLTDRYGGTGGLDGPAEWNGKIKRRVWGRVWNLAGEVIDKANNIWCWADPARPIQAFDELRDKGAPAAATTLLPWQGSAAATLAALQAAAAPRGGGVLCPSIACVKWWTQPAGDLCADLRGEIGGGYVEDTAQVVARIVQAGPNLPFAAGTVAAASALRPAPMGWVADDDSTTTAATIDELLGNVSLLWLLDASGQIVIREWTWGAPVAAVKSASVKRTSVFRPVVTRRIGYRRNSKIMARGDLAAIVLAEDVQFEGGLTGDAVLTQLNDVQALADASAVAIEAAADDGTLDRKEKASVLIPRDGTLEQAWALFDGKAAALTGYAEVVAARAVASDARSAWHVYRDSISPAWNNVDLDSAVSRSMLTGKLNDYAYAIDALSDALRKANAVNNVNRVRNSQFESGTGWGVVSRSANVTIVSPLSVTSVGGYPTLSLSATNSGGGDQYVSIGNEVAGSNGIVVIEGERLAWQARLGAHGGGLSTLAAFLHWYNAAGVRLAPSTQVAGATAADDGTLFQYFVTVPVGAVKAYIEYQAFFAGSGDVAMTFAAPMVSSATSEQTIFPPFTGGSSDGSAGVSPVQVTLTPATISLQLAADGSVKAGQLPASFAVDARQGGGAIAVTSITIDSQHGGSFAVSGSAVVMSALNAGATAADSSVTVVAGGQSFSGLPISVTTARDGGDSNVSAKTTNVPTLAQANGGSFAQVGNAASINASASGKLSVSLTGSILPGADGYGFTSKLQYSTNGGSSWADATTATASTLSDSVTIGDGGGPVKEVPARVQGGGPVTITGLGASTACQVRVVIFHTAGTTNASGIVAASLIVYAEQVA